MVTLGSVPAGTPPRRQACLYHGILGRQPPGRARERATGTRVRPAATAVACAERRNVSDRGIRAAVGVPACGPSVACFVERLPVGRQSAHTLYAARQLAVALPRRRRASRHPNMPASATSPLHAAGGSGIGVGPSAGVSRRLIPPADG